MLEAEQLPAGVTHLAAALADHDGEYFTHCGGRGGGGRLSRVESGRGPASVLRTRFNDAWEGSLASRVAERLGAKVFYRIGIQTDAELNPALVWV